MYTFNGILSDLMNQIRTQNFQQLKAPVEDTFPKCLIGGPNAGRCGLDGNFIPK